MERLWTADDVTFPIGHAQGFVCQVNQSDSLYLLFFWGLLVR